jgi:hypothetical protein
VLIKPLKTVRIQVDQFCQLLRDIAEVREEEAVAHEANAPIARGTTLLKHVHLGLSFSRFHKVSS